jgi:hypothetical protein
MSVANEGRPVTTVGNQPIDFVETENKQFYYTIVQSNDPLYTVPLEKFASNYAVKLDHDKIKNGYNRFFIQATNPAKLVDFIEDMYKYEI